MAVRIGGARPARARGRHRRLGESPLQGVVVSGLLASCGALPSLHWPGSRPTPPSVVIDGHRMRYLGRGQVRADFPAAGIRIAPPTKDAVIGWTDAAHACFRPQLGCVPHDNASVTLVDATIYGQTFLMYAVAWDAVDCASFGPADPEGSSGSCRQVDLVGAGGETPGTAGVHAFTVVGDAVTTRGM